MSTSSAYIALALQKGLNTSHAQAVGRRKKLAINGKDEYEVMGMISDAAAWIEMDLKCAHRIHPKCDKKFFNFIKNKVAPNIYDIITEPFRFNQNTVASALREAMEDSPRMATAKQSRPTKEATKSNDPWGTYRV